MLVQFCITVSNSGLANRDEKSGSGGAHHCKEELGACPKKVNKNGKFRWGEGFALKYWHLFLIVVCEAESID